MVTVTLSGASIVSYFATLQIKTSKDIIKYYGKDFI